MKKYLSWAALVIGVFAMTPGVAATNSGTRGASSADLTSGPAVRERAQVNYEKYETRTSTKTYDAADAKNLYYTQPASRSALYKQYATGSTNAGAPAVATVRTTRSETYRTELRRKYYLAHPFFQPLQGKFGSVTDLSYTGAGYDMTITPLVAAPSHTGAWDMSQFAIKEDFSYGITDRFAVLAMAQYNIADTTFDWNDLADSSMDDNGFDVLGLGVQWRFVDTTDWIATLSAYYQYQDDFSNNIVLDLKGGYKIGRSTLYGLGRAWYIMLDGNMYGNGVTNSSGETEFIAYDMNVDSLFYAEGGLGVFSVLDEDWTLNVEGVFGYYDWHSQLNIKAAIGWQPNDWVALNLYGKFALYDSADGQDFPFLVTDYETGKWEHMATAHLDGYSEMTVGLQAIFSF